MLIDTVQQYDEEKKKYLKDLWSQIILNIATRQDHKKIVTFLAKAGIIGIEEETKKIVIGGPNDLMLSSVKKFFDKDIKEAVKSEYNSQFDVNYVIYPQFSSGSDLLINLQTLLNIKPNKGNSSIKQGNSSIDDIGSIKKGFSDIFGILFDPQFRFDNFIPGSNNAFACSAAKAVAENPGSTYNPLFFYGDVGLGKTHLMQAIGNEIINNDRSKTVIYLPTSKLVDEIVNATLKSKLPDLMKKFDDVDVLLIDDIQFLAGKDKTQEIFHNIFNDFQSKKKQVIISGDRPPKELTNIEPRLKSRFGLGLIADLQIPDFETRVAIIHSKLDIKQETLDSEFIDIIATHVKSNVRELEGALNTILSRKKLMNSEISQNDVYSCLQTLGYSMNSYITPQEKNSKSQKNFDTIVDMVANYYSVSVSDLKSESRKHEITTARQILMLIAKKHFKRTLEKIGMYFGGKNHAGVIYAINKTNDRLKKDKDLLKDYNIFVERIDE